MLQVQSNFVPEAEAVIHALKVSFTIDNIEAIFALIPATPLILSIEIQLFITSGTFAPR